MAYFEQEYRIARSDGVYRWIYDFTVVVRDSDGNITHYLGYVLDFTERVEAEKAMRQSEKKFRSLYENMRDAFAVVDMSGRILECNNEFKDMLGYSEDEIKHLNYTDITPEKWRAIEDKIIKEQVLERGYSDVYQKEYLRKDGTIIAVELRTNLIRDDCAKPVAMWAIVRDITDRKRAQEALQERERQYSQIVNTANEGIWVLDANSKATYCNARMAQILGYEIEELLGEKLDKFLFPEDVLDHYKHTEARRQGTSGHYERRFRRRDGSTVWTIVSAAPIYNSEHEFKGSFAMFTDITDRKLAEDAIKEQANEWQWLMKSMASPFAIFESAFDETGRLVDVRFWYFNDAYARLAKLELDNVRGKLVSDVWFGIEPEWFEYFGNVAITGESKSFEAYFGPIKTFFACTAYRPWDSPQRFCAVYEDITERKHAEEELKQYNRMLQILSACNEALVRITDENTLLQEICRLIVEVGGYHLVWVGYAEHDEARTVRMAARWGLRVDYLDKIAVTWADNEFGRGPVGTAIRLDRVCIINDTQTDPSFEPWRKASTKYGYASVIAIPLHGNGEVLGALTVYASSHDAFHKQEVELLSELASDLEYGITALRTRVDRARALEALKTSESKLQSIFRASPVGIGMVSNRVINFINDRVASITGYTASELVGMSSRVFYLSDQDFVMAGQSLYGQIRESGIGTVDCKWKCKDGRIIDVIITASALEQKEPYNIVFTMWDVTSRKNLEREREQLIQSLATKNEELESIIYVGSHDLRSPQVNIQGFGMELIKTCSELKELIKSSHIAAEMDKKITQLIDTDIPMCVEFISAGIGKMGAVLDGLLTISRLGRLDIRLEPVDMNAIVKSILESIEYKIKLNKIVVEVGLLPECIADRVQISDVFFNIIDNAVKFLSPSRQGVIKISGERKDGTIIYCVEDNGIGINENYFQNIFEPFHKLDPKRAGLGLGLTIAKRIVNRLNGKIWVESREGQWSRFYVELPATS